jgi:hypothetical protein
MATSSKFNRASTCYSGATCPRLVLISARQHFPLGQLNADVLIVEPCTLTIGSRPDSLALLLTYTRGARRRSLAQYAPQR